jgi:hypothetical protein
MSRQAVLNILPVERDLRPERDLRIVPLVEARAEWNDLVRSHPAATLYHRAPWLEVLERAFGVRPSVALLREFDWAVAGCLLARGGNPIHRTLISIPFSDFCPPLALDDRARESLLAGLAAIESRPAIELRGVAGAHPWKVLDHFQRWTLDLSRPFDAIEKGADREIRRHLRRAREAGVSVECSRDIGAIESFFKLQLENRRRLGVPAQPLRFFRLVHEVFSKLDSIEVWFATHHGHPIAAVVVLRDGDVLHAKWSARTSAGPDGASHLVFMSIAEHHAQRAAAIDFGRTDSRNQGLARFKRQLGATPHDLPYSYFPELPSVTSAETLTGWRQTASRVYRNLPLPAARVVSSVTYRYLA